MAATCPEDSSLPQFCVGGQFSPLSCDLSETPDIRVVLRLVDANGNQIKSGISDPTSCSEFMPTVTEEIHVGTSGCWCVCVPFANFSSVDPLRAVTPANSWWEIRLYSGNAETGTWSILGKPRLFQIDADHDYDGTCGTCSPYTTSCGDCIPLTCLLAPTGTVPTTIDNAWCDAVMGCPGIADLAAQVAAWVDTNTFVTFGTDADGNIVATNADGTQGPTFTNDFVTFGTDADGNITITNADGSPGPTIIDTDTFVTFGTDADGNITATNADGTPGPVWIDTDTFVTFGTDADGNVVATNADGTAGPTFRNTFVTFGTDADGNITTVNADGTAGPTIIDTNTTNDGIALSVNGDGDLVITLTDSEGDEIEATMTCAQMLAFLDPCLPGNTVDTNTFVTFGTDADGNIVATNADGTQGPTFTNDFVTFGTDGDGNITVTNADGTAGPTLCPAPCGGGTTTSVALAGETLPCDADLPTTPITTIDAGDPLPEGYTAIYEVNADGNCVGAPKVLESCPQTFLNVAYTEETITTDSLAGLEFIDVDWNGGDWTSTAIAPATDPIIGQSYTKLNAGTFNGQAYDIRATISFLGDSAQTDDYLQTSDAFPADNLSGVRSPPGVNGALSVNLNSRTTTAGVPAGSEQLMVLDIEVFEAGTNTPLAVNAYQQATDLDEQGDTIEMVSFGGQVAGYGLTPSSTVQQGVTSAFTAANMGAQDGIRWEGTIDDPGSDGSPASSVTAVYLDQSSWQIGLSYIRSNPVNNFAGLRIFNVSTDPEPTMVVESMETETTIFYRSVDCAGNDVWRDVNGAIVDPAPTDVINGIPGGEAGPTTTTVPAKGTDRMNWGYDTYTDNPAGVIAHTVFRDGLITDISHTVGTVGDPVTYDILVNGTTVASIGGGDVPLTSVTGLSIAVAAGDVVTIAPTESPAPANLPMWGHVQVRIEES